ncbi:MAG: hypothetical protein P4L59_14010 [Desulfosporosinus sp.]|nr:hypothetical protein [Desulfosporosinus sp.]
MLICGRSVSINKSLPSHAERPTIKDERTSTYRIGKPCQLVCINVDILSVAGNDGIDALKIPEASSPEGKP